MAPLPDRRLRLLVAALPVLAVLSLSVLSLAAPGVAGPAAAADGPTAATAQEARSAAGTAAAEVSALRERLAAAVAAYDATLAAVSATTSEALRADRGAEDAQAGVAGADARRVARIRQLYMDGGELATYARMLRGASAHDLVARLASVRGMLAADRAALGRHEADAAARRAAADRAERAADAAGTRAGDVRVQRAALDALLADAHARLAALTAQAESKEAAERARAAVAEAVRETEQEAQAAERSHTGSAQGRAVPAGYGQLYRDAAATCPGLPWAVLAAVGQVESDHGANAVESSAGAQGPMQFMPATFASYGVDGDGDGDTDISDPADAIHSAAAYLCATGGGDPATLRRALWHYNHAQWYVDLVLGVARELDPAIGLSSA